MKSKWISLDANLNRNPNSNSRLDGYEQYKSASSKPITDSLASGSTFQFRLEGPTFFSTTYCYGVVLIIIIMARSSIVNRVYRSACSIIGVCLSLYLFSNTKYIAVRSFSITLYVYG